MDGCQAMMKSILDNLWPEPRPNMWHKFDIEASCIRNLFHQDRRWMENSIAMFLGEWGKKSSTNIQTGGATTPGSCIMTTLWLTGHSCGSFWFLWRRNSSPTLPTHWTSPPLIFSYSQRWNWSSRDDILTALKRSRLNCRTWRRCWWEMTSSSASDYGNPAGITVSMQKGTTWKGMEANRNFSKWLSYGRGTSGTFG